MNYNFRDELYSSSDELSTMTNELKYPDKRLSDIIFLMVYTNIFIDELSPRSFRFPLLNKRSLVEGNKFQFGYPESNR